jgi:hypothetical protein
MTSRSRFVHSAFVTAPGAAGRGSRRLIEGADEQSLPVYIEELSSCIARGAGRPAGNHPWVHLANSMAPRAGAQLVAGRQFLAYQPGDVDTM